MPLQLHLLVQLQAQVACAAARMRQAIAGSVPVWATAPLALPKALMLLGWLATGPAAGAGSDFAAVPLGGNSGRVLDAIVKRGHVWRAHAGQDGPGAP